jgi:hypothetical protein
MTIPLRHRCRNPKCRMKLSEPADNEHHAFCTPGCHTSFYRRRCLVCEKALPEGPANRKTCKNAECRSSYRRFPHAYDFPRGAFKEAKSVKPTPGAGFVERPSKTSIKPGVFWRDKTGRGWRWEQLGDELWLFDRDEDVQARLVPDGEHYIVRLSLGIDYSTPLPLEDAKRLAVSLALARLPLEPKVAARLARLNELPPEPPQNLLTFTADYLASIANVSQGADRSTTDKIVPDLVGEVTASRALLRRRP